MENAGPDAQKLVNKKTIALRYGVGERTIQEWMEKKMIPFYKIGYMVRFNEKECDEGLARFKVLAAQ